MGSYRRHKRHVEMISIIGRIVCILLVLCGILLLIWAWEQKDIYEAQNASEGEEVYTTNKPAEIVSYNGKDYTPKKDLQTILVIGHDNKESDPKEKGAAPTYSQADMIFLVVADEKAKEYYTIHINRDTMTTIRELASKGAVINEYEAQIALSYAYGGSDKIRCGNTVNAVSNLLGGIKIRNYVAVGMDAVPMLNDSVGGVSVKVMDDIDNDLKKGTTVTLTGDQALRYVRARETLEDSTNLHRMERQKEYIEAFRPLFVKKASDDPTFVLEELTMLGDKMYTDCPIDTLADIVSDLTKMKSLGYLTLEGEAKDGEKYVEFYPDEAALKDMIMTVFYEEVE